MTDQDQTTPDPAGPPGDPPAPLPPVELTFDPQRVLRIIFVACLTVIISLFILDFFVNYRGWATIGAVRRIFNTAREDSMAGWLAVTQTFMVALTLWVLFVTARQQGGSRWRSIGWLVLALFFTYMAADDGAHLHERLGTAFKTLHRGASEDESWGAAVLAVFPSYTWQILFVPVYGAFGLFTLVFLWRELGDRRSKILAAVALSCLVVAVGLDFLEGLEPTHDLNPYSMLADRFELDGLKTKGYRSPYRVLRHFSKSLEECIEMLGVNLLWLVFLGHWFRTAANLQVRFVWRAGSL